MQYLLAHRSAASGEAGWPLLVFLHGRGETGGELAKVKVHGPIKAAASMAEFPFLVVAPHLPIDTYWEPPGVLAVIDEVIARWPVDTNRIYLTGLSLGGHGTWATAAAAPARFAAIAPVSGRGDPDDACAIADVPVWAFHGVLDTVVDDAWTPTYARPELYAWLLSHALDNGNEQ